MFNRKGLAALMCLVGILAGAACQSRLEPSPIESSAASPSKTSSPHQTPSATSEPTSEPPSMPAEALKPTRSGVEAFITYYFKMFNYARKTNDWREFRTLSTSTCDLCKALSTNQLGRYRTGGEWYTLPYGAELRPPAKAFATVPMRSKPGVWVSTPSGKPTPTRGDRWLFDIYLAFQGDQWRIYKMVLVR